MSTCAGNAIQAAPNISSSSRGWRNKGMKMHYKTVSQNFGSTVEVPRYQAKPKFFNVPPFSIKGKVIGTMTKNIKAQS